MKKILFFCLMAIALASCVKSEHGSADAVLNGDLTVATPTVSNVSHNGATLSSSATGIRSFSKRGFCMSTVNATPTATDDAVVETSDGFTVAVTSLSDGVKYYVRAYVYAEGVFYYSDVTTFTTTAITLEEKLQDYIANSIPQYPDNYLEVNSWDSRSQWNLANVHDPTVMKAADGYYYMYQTDASYGNVHDGHGHFHGRRSLNLVDWEYLGGTMQNAPGWVKDSLNSYRETLGLEAIESPAYGYWAPCARKVGDDLYRMYYSIVVSNLIATGGTDYDGSWGERAFIGVMETDLAGLKSNTWTDKGYVICSASDRGTNWQRSSESDWNAFFKFNAIDPSYIITNDGDHWLVYGSWHCGFAAVQIDPETGKTLAELPAPYGTNSSIAPYGTLVNTRTTGSRWQASEAPEVVYRDGYYYLFMAYDGLAVPYNTRVVRAKSITGPYYGIDGTNVTNGGDAFPIVTHPYKFQNSNGWVGISHCAVFDDGAGNWFYASQGRFPENVDGNAYSNAIMLGQVRSIIWTEEGWPLVMPERYGAVPQAQIYESELYGDWEHITLKYQYGKQDESVDITLKSDHTVSGSWMNGKAWSYDESKQILTIGGAKLYLQREVDWEASPREVTIVYAGIYGNNTLWGKMK